MTPKHEWVYAEQPLLDTDTEFAIRIYHSSTDIDDYIAESRGYENAELIVKALNKYDSRNKQ